MSEVEGRIQSMVEKSPYVLFMKGTRTFPQCGFSATVVSILDEYLPEYETFNVLADQDVREGVKVFSDWPTIPQLYVKGEFVGGCDIVREMHESGELAEVLGKDRIEVTAPAIEVTEAAQKAFVEAREQEEHQDLRLEITGQWQYALSFGPALPGDVELDVGDLKLRMDRGTARRADGMKIDFVSGPEGTGFKIDNPNEPPKVKQIGPQELKEKLDAGAIQYLYDVRPDEERAISKLDMAKQLTDDAVMEIESLSKDTPLAFHCRSGKRSQQAAQLFLQKGYTEVYNLAGGINAWAQEVDPELPVY